MHISRHTSSRVGAVAMATVVSFALGGVLLAQTRSAAPARNARTAPPRTPWGTPDLQGIWNNSEVVPFERPKEFGLEEFKNDEQMKEALDELLERNQRPGRDSREVEGQAGRGTEKDVARAYNEHWFGDKPTAVGRRTSMIVDPPDGRLPALTPEATKRIAEKREFLQALLQGTSGGRPGPISPRRSEPSPDYNLDRINRSDGPEDRGGPERCLGTAQPVIMQAGSFGGVARIVQAPDSVSIYYDIGQGQGFAWVAPITNRPHLPQSVRLFHGDPIARWEGDSLVVDITNFTQKTNFRGSRENLHVITRYKRLNADTLEIRTTVEDPTTWVKPWTFVQELKKNPDQPNMVFEGGCHEGNYGLLGMLANTRAAEKLFAEGKGPDPATQDNATGGGVD
ncbi:MAG: hypothetical protein AB7I13_14245 [Vicinamibacterales bacterium]